MYKERDYVEKIGQTVDMLNLMTYDLYDVRTNYLKGRTYHPAPLCENREYRDTVVSII